MTSDAKVVPGFIVSRATGLVLSVVMAKTTVNVSPPLVLSLPLMSLAWTTKEPCTPAVPAESPVPVAVEADPRTVPSQAMLLIENGEPEMCSPFMRTFSLLSPVTVGVMSTLICPVPSLRKTTDPVASVTAFEASDVV